MLDDTDLDFPEEPRPEPPPRRSGNRFMVIAGALGGIMLLALIAIVAYALIARPQPAAPGGPSADQLTGTALVLAAQATGSAAPTQTSTPTSTRTNTPRPTNTPLITNTPEPATATVNALLTQAALAQTQAALTSGPGGPTATGATTTPGTPGTPGTVTVTPRALPTSGFADEVGAPGLLAAAAVLLAVIILARRLRNAD